MNNNKYVEFSVKPKNESREKVIYLVLKYVKYLFIVVTFVFGYVAFMFSNAFWFLFAFSLLFVIGLHFFQGKIYAFFDVTFVDGDVTITKVINNVKRKRILSFTHKQVEMIGKIGGETYLKYLKDKTVKKIYLSDNLTVDDVCIYINDNVDYLVILPYNDKFLVSILRYLTKQKFEKAFFDIK